MSYDKNQHTDKPSSKEAAKLAEFRGFIKESSEIAEDIAALLDTVKGKQAVPKNEQQNDNKMVKYFSREVTVQKSIAANLDTVKRLLGRNVDFISREFTIGVKNQTKAFLCFIDGLGDKKLINDHILKPLLVDIYIVDPEEKLLTGNILDKLKKHVFEIVEMKEQHDFDEAIDAILSGNTALFIDGYDIALIISAKGSETRAIKEPDTEMVVRGSREGFVETLRVNTSIIRRMIKNPKLVIEPFRLGRESHTEINIAYIEGVANPKIINEVKRRLNKMDTASVTSSGYLEQIITDSPYSFFSTMSSSERPEKVTGKILEGRVAIFVNGTPFVLTVPHLFIENFQATEDYGSKFYFGSFVRLLRLLSFLITVAAPALYVAIETYHQEMLPTVLLITAAAAREGIPFPAFLETLIMSIVFEFLRESGVRLPRQIGQAVSIVGALVVGEAVVRAGIISAPMVIIGAVTTITGFLVPSLLEALVFFRIILFLLSTLLGLYGFIVGMLLMLAHLCSLRSFGVPYLSPLSPIIVKDLKDTFIILPIKLLISLPKSVIWKKEEER